MLKSVFPLNQLDIEKIFLNCFLIVNDFFLPTVVFLARKKYYVKNRLLLAYNYFFD